MGETHHLSTVSQIRRHLIEMGECTLALYDQVTEGIVESKYRLTTRVRDLTEQIDNYHCLVHDECFQLIALQAPAASDARFILDVLDAIVELVLIGEYIGDIAAQIDRMEDRPSLDVLAPLAKVARRIRSVLEGVIDSWRIERGAYAIMMRREEGAIREECGALHNRLARLALPPMDRKHRLGVMLVARSLLRVLRYASGLVELNVGTAPPELALVRDHQIGRESGLAVPVGAAAL